MGRDPCIVSAVDTSTKIISATQKMKDFNRNEGRIIFPTNKFSQQNPLSSPESSNWNKTNDIPIAKELSPIRYN
jgi:hypothetical protein